MTRKFHSYLLASGGVLLLAGVLSLTGIGTGSAQGQAGTNSLEARVSALETKVADLQAALNNEIAARQAADNQLRSDLTAETAARQQGDSDTLAASKAYTDQKVANVDAVKLGGVPASAYALKTDVDSEASARQAADTALSGRISPLEAKTEFISINNGNQMFIRPGFLQLNTGSMYIELSNDRLVCLNGSTGANLVMLGSDVMVRSANLRLQNGTEATSIANGLGNLILGYNESRTGGADGTDNRIGSHNLILGRKNNYDGYGGIVAGYHNSISGELNSVLGGTFNIANGLAAVVCGGGTNQASGSQAVVSGGRENVALEDSSAVSGGFHNLASNSFASVTGGAFNTAAGLGSSVAGGDNNTANGFKSVISGGQFNIVNGKWSAISGWQSVTLGTDNAWSVGGYHVP
ncbi:MAG TPA: hypothetical protein VFB38_25340 [Chthonomonadaceae bacterium]|nr:hypothetical protein [Chthonomonadaceae bacterium]